VERPIVPLRLVRLASVLKVLADNGLTAASVLAKLHHRRVVPLMERRLRIFKMHEEADPVALVQSWLLHDLLLKEYAAMRASCTVNLRAMRVDDAALWAFTMLPEGPLVSGIPTPPSVFRFVEHCHDLGFPSSLAGDGRECCAVRPAHSLSPSTRAGSAAARAGVGGAPEGAEHPAMGAPGAEERGVLVARAAGDLLPRDLGVLVVGRGGGGGKRWGPGSPREVGAFAPSPRAAEAAEETTPGAGAGATASRQPMGEATRAAEMTGAAAAAAPVAATTSAEPPRKMKRGYSTLR
jgi:hypothetical protein